MHDEAWGGPGPRDPREHRGGHRMRARVRGGAPWPGPVGPFEFGMRGGGPFGPPKFRARGPRVRRGDVRAAILDLLAEGRAYVEEHADELRASWDAVTGSVDAADVQLWETVRQVAVAVTQVAQAGSAAQVQQAAKILADTRRALYRILAADGEETEQDTQG